MALSMIEAFPPDDESMDIKMVSKEIGACVIEDLGYQPDRAYFTFHDVKRVAELATKAGIEFVLDNPPQGEQS